MNSKSLATIAAAIGTFAVPAAAIAAGDVVATMRGDTLVLEGDDEGNSVFLEPDVNNPHLLVVNGVDTTINGATSFVAEEPAALLVSLGDGDDFISSDDLFLFGLNPAVFQMGDGDDRVSFLDGGSDGDMRIDTGLGDDFVDWDFLGVGGDLVLHTHDGSDQISGFLGFARGKTFIDAGRGFDRARIVFDFDGPARIKLQGGNDSLSLEGSFGASAALRGGQGIDDLELTGVTFSAEPKISDFETVTEP